MLILILELNNSNIHHNSLRKKFFIAVIFNALLIDLLELSSKHMILSPKTLFEKTCFVIVRMISLRDFLPYKVYLHVNAR